MTMTSNRICAARLYLPIQKREKMCASTSSGVALAGDLLECRARLLQIGEHEFLRQRPAAARQRPVAREQRWLARARPARCAGRS